MIPPLDSRNTNINDEQKIKDRELASGSQVIDFLCCLLKILLKRLVK